MFNKSFGLIATVALTLVPMSAFAQQTQVNSQNASNSAVAVGAGNTVIQNTDQTNIQNQFGLDGYYNDADPQLQINQQNAVNSGAAIGTGNTLIQNVDQKSLQQQYGIGY
jgi:hypothetical protein